MSKTAPLFEVGYVARAHGLQGELGVRTFDPASETLFDVEFVTLRAPDGQTTRARIDSIRSASKELLVRLDGVSNRTQAEALKGTTLLVDRSEVSAPEEGEFFQQDLIGLTAVEATSETLLGTVEEVWETGPVPNLVIRAAGKEWVLPFADEFFPKLDLVGRKIWVVLPEYEEVAPDGDTTPD